MLNQYIQQFEAVYRNQPWYGDNLLSVLEDVTDAEAFTRPAPNLKSLAELVAHVIYWRQSLIKRLEGDTSFKASMKSEDNWPALVSLKNMGWPALCLQLEQTQQQLLKQLQRHDETVLQEPYRTGTSVQQLIEGVLQHDIYHQGQMALVKKMVRQL